MLDAQRLVRAPATRFWVWAVPLAGLLGGVLGAGLLTALRSPWTAIGIIAAVPIGLVMLAMPYATLYVLLATMIAGWPGFIMKFAGFGVTLSTFFWAVSARRRLIPSDWLLAIYVPLIGWIWVEALRIGDPDTINKALSYTSYLALYWMLSTLATSSRAMSRMVLALVLSGIVIALIAFVQFKYPFVWISSTSRLPDGAVPDASISAFAQVQLDKVGDLQRVESLTGTSDYLGMSMQILLPFAFFWTVRQHPGYRRTAGVVACLLLTGALVLSFTRGVLFSTAVIVVPMFAAKVGWRKSLPLLVTAAVLVCAPALLWETGRERVFSTISEWVNNDPSTAGGWRRQLLPIAMDMFRDYFWSGVGLNQHQTLWPHYAPVELVPGDSNLRLPLHNGYLLLGIELGVIGFGLVAALVAATWWRTRRLQVLFRAQGDGLAYDLARAAEVAWIGLAFNAAFYPVLDGSYRYFWVLLAIIGGLSRLAQDRNDAAAVDTRPAGSAI